MKSYPLALCLLLIAMAQLCAQDKPAKSDKPKTLTFQPGSKVPDELANATPAATPAEGADSARNAQAPGVMVATFFSFLQKGEIDPAYESLTRTSKIGERPEEVKTLKNKTKEAIEVFGPVLGHELAETKVVGTRLLRRTYLSLNRDFPLRWRFYFYLSGNTWRLIDLRVDDRVSGMFDEPEEGRSADGKL